MRVALRCACGVWALTPAHGRPSSYVRNAALLNELFSEDARPFASLLDTRQSEAACAALRARIRELRAAEAQLDQRDARLSQSATAVQRRFEAVGKFMSSVERASNLEEVRTSRWLDWVVSSLRPYCGLTRASPRSWECMPRRWRIPWVGH